MMQSDNFADRIKVRGTMVVRVLPTNNLRINQLLGVACLSVALVLCPKPFGLIELNVYVSIPSRNFIITPSSMAVVLTADKKRYDKTISNKIMFESGGMSVLDEVSDESFIFFI